MSSTDHLIGLGLNKNEAKALDALISLGPSGASDVHKYAGIPRNKAYESLERLAARGMIEIQQGRPTLYRALGAKTVIDNLIEEYSKEANEARRSLERKQEEFKEGAESDAQNTSAWMVRGELGVKRKLAELIYNAKTDIFIIGGYPLKYALSVKSALKSASKRGLRVRAVSMIRPFEDVDISSEDSKIIEFRTVKVSPKLLQKIDIYDQRLIDSYRSMSGYGGMVVIDESTAFDIVDDGKDPKKVAGIVFRAPGIPKIQKATVERIIGLYTRRA
ncbi:MAG: TrmB family transcriptional regulator [Nitrososphaerota archaeon]|nr:TrmB family transcriptional regulator [Nitrososphaerota archaeon]